MAQQTVSEVSGTQEQINLGEVPNLAMGSGKSTPQWGSVSPPTWFSDAVLRQWFLVAGQRLVLCGSWLRRIYLRQNGDTGQLLPAVPS